MRDSFSSNLIEKLGTMSAHEILSMEKDGRYFAALSPDRVNVIDWYPFKKEETLLQAGADRGAFLPVTDRTARWDIFDPEKSELDIVRARILSAEHFGGADIGNGSMCGLFTEMPEGHYDILFFAVWPGRNRAEELIRAVTPDTVLILAENASALKFMTGAKKEPDRFYITAEELDDFAAGLSSAKDPASSGKDSPENGKPEASLYYPLPSLMFAKDIRSENAAPGPGDFRGAADRFTEQRSVTCDEEALFDSLTAFDRKSIRRYAPAFLYVIRNIRQETDLPREAQPLPDYIRYNRSRKPGFRIRTELYPGKRAEKTALCSEADAHIKAFEKRYERLVSSVPEGLRVSRPETCTAVNGRAKAVFPFEKGESLGQRLAASVKDGKAPAEEMEAALERMIGTEERPQYNIDILFDNILADGDTYTLIDYEWTADEPQPYRFVRYRVLRYFYEDNAQTLTAYANLAAFLQAFGFSKDERDAWEQEEDRFQLYVHGGDKGSFEDRFRRDASSVSAIREEARRMFADEIDELKASLRRERETERLSQQHIRNIENINKARDAEIAVLKSEISWLEEHVSPVNRFKRRMIRKIDAWAPADSGKRLVLKYMKGTLRHPGTYLKRYLTGEGHNFIRGNFAILGEFSEGGILEIPAVAPGKQPLVTVVIPAYNQVAYTYACIRSVIGHTDFEETPYEVILADDASNDATAEITNWIRNLKVARTQGNLGFLRNCNNAAAQAAGEYIFFLNNDTKVTDGWLSSLVKLMKQDETIGMCGSKLVYPDGRLQEAGGIIWSDASGWNYGRMDDPGKFCYNYVKDVDYISGAAILIRTSLWKEIGGFDERYAPAYCEDSDLAFEVRRHGRRVVYQPASTVIHFEGISNGTDVGGTGLKRYQTVNQEKFREKWAEELKEQSENTGNPNPFAARERSQKKKTILVIDHYVPHFDRDAGSKTTWQYLQMFVNKGYNVKFLGDDFRSDEPYTAALEQLGVEVLYGDEIRLGVYDWIMQNRAFIDIAYLNRPHIAVKYIDFLKENTKIRCIYYGHDLHYLRIRREYELTGDIQKRRESEYWKSVEYQVMEKADMVYYPSQDEINEIHARRPEIPAKAITAYIYDDPVKTTGGTFLPAEEASLSLEEASLPPKSAEGNVPPVEKTSGMLFVGGFKHPPNADGVLWFAAEIWPRIRKELPDAGFFVAGSSPTEDVLELDGKDGIHVLGFVSDEELEQLYCSTRLTVVPLRYGAGVKGKVVEALHLGCAIVTTSVGAEGIPEAETAMKLADTPENFAALAVRVYNDDAEATRMRAAAAPLIRKYYSTDAAWQIIAEDFA